MRPGDNLQAALNRAGRNASICFTRGTYRLREELRPRAGQDLTFAPGAVLNGSKLVRNWTKDGRHWVAGGQTQRFDRPSNWSDQRMCSNNNEAACVFEDFFIDGRPLRHVRSRGELRPGRVYFDKNNNRIYIADNPRGRTIEATRTDRGISVHRNRVTIRGATVEKFGLAGIYVKANRATITNSRIRFVHLNGIQISGGTGRVIRNNRIHRNGVTGMTMIDSSRVTIRNNRFDRNNYLRAGPIGGWHEGAVKILRSRDVVARKNWSARNFGDGLWFDWDNYNILIENNLLERNARHGLFYEASFDAIVRYNTIRGNGTVWAQHGAGIFNSTSKNVRYVGNRIANNVIRAMVIRWDGRGRSDEFGERQSANILFRDNVVAFHKNHEAWIGAWRNADSRVYRSNNRFQGNRYIAPRNTEMESRHFWRWERGHTWREWRARGFDTNGSFRWQGGPRVKVRAAQKRPVRKQFFLRDDKGCASNENLLSIKAGPSESCRDIDQEPLQVWSAINGTPFKLDASRPITGEVTTTGGQCVADGGCSPTGIGAGFAELDVVVLGTIGGVEKELGAYRERFVVTPGDRHTSHVNIKLDAALADTNVTSLRVLTYLHGEAIGHNTVVLENPTSFITMPAFVTN